MSFDAILGILLSILLPKIFENIANENNTKILIRFKILIITLIFFTCINIDKFLAIVANESFVTKYNKLISSDIFICLSILILIMAIIFTYNNSEQGKCNFKKLSKVIVNFTNQVSDNAILYIFCGDMDVWEIEEGGYNSKELQQLINLQKENRNLDIRILCKHCMEESLIEDISKTNYTEDDMENETRFNSVQVERIAFFKNNLKCSFRFYKDPNDDYSDLRARVIKSHGIKKVLVYHKSTKTSNIGIFQWFEKYINKKNNVYEYHSYINSDDYQLLHYVELCDLKWNGCNAKLALKIEEYCLKYCQIKRGEKSLLKKIAFVYAKTYEVAHYGENRKEFPPFGVMYLAAMVREHCPKWLAEIIAIEENDININAKYDVIAFSVISAYTVPVFEKCMNEIKKQKLNAICIAGGYQAELEGEKWLKSKLIKLVLKGEGEYTIVKLLNDGIDKAQIIPGAMFIKGNKFRSIPLDGNCVDLDNIPMPARDLLPEEDYIMNDRLANTNYKMVHVMFSRGCSYNCVYCGVRREGNRIVRYRSPQNIVDELEYLKNMGIEGFSIVDDCFLTNEQKALSIIKEISKVGLKWSLTARVDQINKTVIEALVESGCLEIKFGLETGSNKILEEMKKGFTVEEAKEAITLVRKYSIGVKAFIITGLPGENKETNIETEKFLKEMGKENINRVSLLRFVPLPGSHIYENPKDYGIKKDVKFMNKSAYRLYEKSARWWEKEEDYIMRNEIYEHIKTFMLSIWDKI